MILEPSLNLLGLLESPSLLKISQKQFTFVMHLVDEMGLFLDALERNKAQMRSMKDQSSANTDTDMTITICLTIPTTFTLAVLDSLEDELLPLSTPTLPTVPEATVEPDLRDTSDVKVMVDSVPKPVPIVTTPMKIEVTTPMKTSKRSKLEENLQRGFDLFSKGSRGSSLSSSMNASDNSDDTLSQFDMNEDLDGDLDASSYLNESTGLQQQKITRIEIDDDDGLSLMGKHFLPISPSESVCFQRKTFR